MMESYYTFKLTFGCSEVYFHYEPPGEDWDPNLKHDPIDFMPMSYMFGAKTEQEKIDEERDKRAKRGPRIRVEMLSLSRHEDGHVQTNSATLSRQTTEDLRDALTSLLDYDREMRQAHGDESLDA